MVTARVRSSSGETSVTAESCWKRSAESVHGSTLASPRTPCALRMTPTAMRSPMAGSVQDVEDEAAPDLLTGRRQQRAHGARGAALPPDDFAQVLLCDLELDDGRLVALVRADSHRVGIVDQGLRHELDQFLHFVFFRRDFTVGDNCAPLLTQ